MRYLAVLIACLLVIFSSGIAAYAHFSTETVLRTILIARDGDRLTAYIHTPVPLLFSDTVLEAAATGTAIDNRFIKSEDISTGTRYRLSVAAIAANERAFVRRLESALAWSQDSRPLSAHLTAFSVQARASSERFDSVTLARQAVTKELPAQDPEFGDAYVAYALDLAGGNASAAIDVLSALPPMPLPEGVTIDNHIIDARGEAPVSYTAQGQLETPKTIDGSVWRTMVRFTWQGVLHIINGIDHVFLVICLALGIGARARLVWIATAFTIGHSATLISTFLGATPTWPWFIPSVETAIAATVLYAAVMALMRRMDSVLIITGVGLLHGLGFSFVLGDILGRDAPNLVPALAAFNIGIEIGQLAIIGAALAVMAAAARLSAGVAPVLRNAALAAIAAMSAWWVIERGASLIA